MAAFLAAAAFSSALFLAASLLASSD